MKKIVLIILLAAGYTWLIHSAFRGLNSGADCDIYRQWVVSQYVRQGINPYAVSLDILRHNYGSMHGENRLRLKDLKIYEVHPNLDTAGIKNYLPEYGPPTATYPPSAVLLISCTAGLLQRPFVWPIWLFVNTVCLAALVFKFSRMFYTQPGRTDSALLWSWALFLIWPPTHEVFFTNQFVFLVLFFLLFAVDLMDRRPWVSGLFFSLALLKPSLTLAFIMLPVIRLKWRVLVAIAVLHGLAGLALCAWVNTAPWDILIQWVEIPRYMLQGAYTIQELVNWTQLDNTSTGMLITLAFVGICFAWCLAANRKSNIALVSFMSFVAILWTYHERYDFVVLLIPASATWFALWERRSGPWIGVVLSLALWVALGIALSDYVYLREASLARALRWAGRGSLGLLFILQAIQLLMPPSRNRADKPINNGERAAS